MSLKIDIKADVGDKVFYLDAQNEIKEDEIIAVDYVKVLENEKPKESLMFVLKSDRMKHVSPDFFETSKEKLKKALDEKFKNLKSE